MSRVELHGVTKSFELGEHRVTPLEDVDLVVESAEFAILLGPSGSGKSTLLHLAAGLDHPDSGSVIVGGTEISKLGTRAAADWRARELGLVFQDYSLVPVLTAYENVELPLWLQPLSRSERHRRTRIALEAVGLADRDRHLPKQLSGGQQQRVAIARAIVTGATLLLADEPTGNLDHHSAEQIWELFRTLHRDFDKTILLVTHDQEALEYGTRGLLLEDGKLHEREVRA